MIRNRKVSNSRASLPWVDKYRPLTLPDVRGNEEIIDKLKSFARSGHFPNMSFVGPPGTGKTTAALCLINDTFKGHGVYKLLNASDERGIKVVRTTIKHFATHTALTAKYKVLVCDEIENMTSPAQMAFREVIGQNYRSCRFILIMNSAATVLEAIFSRCPPFFFVRISDEAVLARLQEIAQFEGKTVDHIALSEIVVESNGDLRTAINRLQTACTGVDVVGEKDVRFMRLPRGADIERVILAAMQEPFAKALEVWTEASVYINPRRFLNGAVQFLFGSQSPLLDRRILAKCLAEVDWRRGMEDIQVIGFLARINEEGEKQRVRRVAKP